MRGRFARKERSASACVGGGCIVVAWSVLDSMVGLMTHRKLGRLNKRILGAVKALEDLMISRSINRSLSPSATTFDFCSKPLST